MSSGTIMEPTPPAAAASRRRRRRGGAGSALIARGEPIVWLIGAGLGVCLLMIFGLLALIFYQGSATFWPKPIVQIQTTDGQTLLGEVTRRESYQQHNEAGELETLDRKLIRTGNRDLVGTPFQWVPSASIEQASQPEWAVLIERRTWGPFIGMPIAFHIDGQPVASNAAEAWALFNEHHGHVTERRERRQVLEDADTGAVNYTLEQQRLRMRAAELDLLDAEQREAPGSPRLAQAQLAYEQATARYEQTQAWASEEFDRIRAQIHALNVENDRYQLIVASIDGRTVALPLGEMVLAYPANQLTFWGRTKVYLARWGEFLTDNPREANTEGGVFPPIIGTVTMTLLMCIVVVPFGMLAALYLREYARPGPIVNVVRIAVNNLAGVPSIVFGVFGLGFFCYMMGGYIDRGPDHPTTMGPWLGALAVLLALAVLAVLATTLKFRTVNSHGLRARLLGYAAMLLWCAAAAVVVWMAATVPFFDGFYAARAADGSPTFGKGGVLWAALTLALLTLPVVIVATEEALAAVPSSMREGSYACGASKWQTVRRIVLPRAMPGIMTGMILAMARGAGEVAPLMLVGALKLAPELPVDGNFPFVHLERSFMHLGFHIYDVGFQSPDSEGAKPMVYTTTLLLIVIIACLNLAAFALRTRLRRRFAEAQF